MRIVENKVRQIQTCHEDTGEQGDAEWVITMLMVLLMVLFRDIQIIENTLCKSTSLYIVTIPNINVSVS